MTSFTNLIDSHRKTDTRKAPDWMTGKPKEGSEPSAPASTPTTSEPQERAFWEYPGLDDSLEHRMPARLRRLMTSNRDFGAWVDTVVMCYALNRRYGLFEALVPLHLRTLVGSDRVTLSEDTNEKNIILWYT